MVREIGSLFLPEYDTLPEMHNTRPHRKHVRLNQSLYRTGSFFITVCTGKRDPILADVQDSRVRLSTIGLLVKDQWMLTPTLRSGVTLGEWVIMPDHFHAVVHLSYVPRPEHSLGALIRGFKGSTTRRCRELVGAEVTSLWQRGFYERVIRNEEELVSIERYVRENPDRWECRYGSC